MLHYGTPLIWRLEKKAAGLGALGNLGAHIIDLGRFLVGEIKSVSAIRTFKGTIGTLDATRFADGHKNHEMLEVNGE